MKFSQALFGLMLFTTFVGCNDVGTKRSQERDTRTNPGLDPETNSTNSFIHRVKGSVVLTYAEEITKTIANDLPEISYRKVPDMEMDDEGTDGTNIILRTSLGRPKVTCGSGIFTGVTARIADCATKNADKAIWEGFRYAASGEGTWQLVSRMDTGKEIWIDNRTGMVWSDTVVNRESGATEFDWCKAAGNNQSPTPTLTIDCNTQAAGESACVNLVMDEIGDQIQWRLPTRNDYLQADLNGARFVLNRENINGLWTATMKSETSGRNMAWIYNSKDGTLTSGELSTTRQVKCIGAPQL